MGRIGLLARSGTRRGSPGQLYEAHRRELLQWLKHLDLLNVLKDDILFSCQAPIPSRATSSSRSTTFSLSKSDLKRANNLFMLYKAYYPTKTLLYLHVCVGCVKLANFFLLGCLYVCVNDVCVSRYSNYKIRYRRYLAM